MSSKYDDDDYGADEKYDSKDDDHCYDAKAEIIKPSEAKDTDPGISDAELIAKVQEYFYADMTLTKVFEAFVKEHAHIVDLEATEKNEYKLEYTRAYEDFKALFEEKMEGFIEKELGVSVQRFYSILKKKTEEDEYSNEAIFGQILLAVTDFDVFMTMMREEARGLPEFFK
jgi:hypothetical protein